MFSLKTRASKGVETVAFLRRNQEVYLRYQSGNGYPPTNNYHSGDCIRASNFRYGQLNIFLYAAVECDLDAGNRTACT